jgi:hypothetical protein
MGVLSYLWRTDFGARWDGYFLWNKTIELKWMLNLTIFNFKSSTKPTFLFLGAWEQEVNGIKSKEDFVKY